VAHTIWNRVLSSLEGEINKQSFNMWLKDTEPLSISENTLIIRVADDVAKRHIAEQYSEQIESILKEISGQKYNCEFITENDFNQKSEQEKQSPVSSENILNSIAQKEKPELILNSSYTFDNFVIGPNNQFAHAAASSVAQSPAKQVNPLFIYGSSGLGKTHLLQAIGHYIIDEKPFLKVLFVSTEQFINEFINSIRNRTQDSFKIKYRDVDILLIDDIQFLENKEETQNEFFHTFNALHENKKQIVIASDRPPKQIATLADRLRTRFEWGMITDIQPPNLETREAILRNKGDSINIEMTDEAYTYIARRIKSNIRALEAAVNRLKMVSTFHKGPITAEIAKANLKELFDVDSNRKLTLSDIMIKVADKYQVTVQDLKSNSRQSKIILPRFTAMFLARKLTDLTTTDIGKEFGDRDHSTVVNAVNKVEENMKKDTEFKERIDDLILELKS